MILDSLVAVNPYFKFAENLANPEVYSTYTDSVVKYIETSRKSEFKEA